MKSSFEEKSKSQAKSESVVIGNDEWLLKETKGNTLFDKFLLSSLKLTYKSIRFLYRIALGKTKRDKLWNDRKITFRGFLYKSIECLGLDNFNLLVFEVPKYNFKFFSKITRKINNFAIQDMVVSMSSHEEEILKHFPPKEGDVVVDVGAAFGFYTILSSKMIGSKGKVIAIEPQPESFQMLNSNIRLNKLSNVKTHSCTIYSKETKLQLYSSYSILPERAGENTLDFIEVNSNKLDNLIFQLEKINEVNWIKIDVEGAELEVLKGATNILAKSKDIALLIEIHNISEGRNHYQSIMDLLNNYDFKKEFEKIYENGERHIIVNKKL